MSNPWLDALSLKSAARENILEHQFLADVASELWRRGCFDLAIYRSEVDDCGYDVVIELGSVTRHIQLKAKYTEGKTARYNVQTALCDKPSGCIVVMAHTLECLKVDHFYFLGSAPGEPLGHLGDKVAKHTKGNSEGIKGERLALRTVPLGSFVKLDTVGNLVDVLFGAVALA